MADALTKTESEPVRVRWRAWPSQRPIAAYLLALSLVTLVFVLRAWLAPTLGNQALYLFLVPPVLIAGIVAGLGPGLVATAYATLLQIFVTGDYRSLIDTSSPDFTVDVVRATVFA